jgi:hypothetical protein
MARILSIFVLPLLVLATFALYLPTAPKAQKIVNHVARIATGQPVFDEPEPESPSLTVYEQLVVPTVNVGPECAQQPEIRIWAIRNDTNYGWIQLPRGTPVYFVRQEGEYVIVRYEETIIRAHRSVVDAGLLILKKSRTYAAAS